MKLPGGSYILDWEGDYGPPYRAYRVLPNGKLRTITPKGFPHPRQVLYLDSVYPNTLWAGQRGSGKTFGAMWDNLFTGWAVPGCQQIIFRRWFFAQPFWPIALS